MKLSKATIDDLEGILNLHNNLFELTYSYENFAYELDLDFSYFMVLKKENTIIGYFVIHQIFEILEIIIFAIDKNHQHKGLGSFLMEVIEYYKVKLSCNEIILEVEDSNKQALSFYKKHGFLHISTRKDYYGKNKDAYILRK